jgi:bacterioferritin-associated ferredoxin
MLLRTFRIIAKSDLMIVCVCNAIRENELRAAARAGASCPTSAYRARGCKPRCGQCFSFAREVIAAELATAWRPTRHPGGGRDPPFSTQPSSSGP